MMPAWARQRREWAAVRAATRIMVVAHPDDETLWGGVTLASDAGWAVICATHRATKARRLAFGRALSALGTHGVMLEVPDRKELRPTEGDLVLLRQAIEPVIDTPRVVQVMTHGPEGEYGHPLHRAISALVTDLCASGDRLWYFDFDADVDVAASAPAAYARKLRAAEAYFGPEPTWVASDRCHVALGRHERPTPAADYVRAWELVSEIYAESGMQIS